MALIVRREVLERDPPVDIRGALAEIRRLTGWGTSVVAFVLNVPRTTLREWEKGRDPGFENGRAVQKLLTKCQDIATQESETGT